VFALFSIEGDVLIDARLGDRPRLFSPQVQRINELTPKPDLAAAVRAQQDRQLVTRDYQAAFLECDVLVQPVAPLPAPRIDEEEARYVGRCVPYGGAANLAGLPAVPLPAGMSGGMPIAIQVIGPPGADALVLRVAYALEQAAPEHRVQTPPLA